MPLVNKCSCGHNISQAEPVAIVSGVLYAMDCGCLTKMVAEGKVEVASVIEKTVDKWPSTSLEKWLIEGKGFSEIKHPPSSKMVDWIAAWKANYPSLSDFIDNDFANARVFFAFGKLFPALEDKNFYVSLGGDWGVQGHYSIWAVNSLWAIIGKDVATRCGVGTGEDSLKEALGSFVPRW